MNSFPHLVLDDGKQIYFGQCLSEVEEIFGESAKDNPSPTARKNKDKIIEVKELSLDFDNDQLNSIEFLSDCQFKHSLNPYNKSWKNFEIIDGKYITPYMCRDEFVAYIETWHNRATNWVPKVWNRRIC